MQQHTIASSLSVTKILLELNVPVNVNLGGETYEVELIGANTHSNEIVLNINGEFDVLKEGENKIMNGLSVFVSNVFISRIKEDYAGARLQLTIPKK